MMLIFWFQSTDRETRFSRISILDFLSLHYLWLSLVVSSLNYLNIARVGGVLLKHVNKLVTLQLS